MREGKGLEQALRAYLDRAAERLTAIEQGEMATLYEIVSIADPRPKQEEPGREDPRAVPPAPPGQDGLFGAPDDVPF